MIIGIIHRRQLHIVRLRTIKDVQNSLPGILRGCPNDKVCLLAPQNHEAFEEARRILEERINSGQKIWNVIMIYPYCEEERTRLELSINRECEVSHVQAGIQSSGGRPGHSSITVEKGQETASYVLHVGDVYYDISRDKKGYIKPGKSLTLNPGDTALISTMEYVFFSHNIVGIVSPAVRSLESGLEQETCFIDPGYYGWLTEVISNRSNRTITIEYGAPLCKLWIIKLDVAPEGVKPEEDRYKGPRLGKKVEIPTPPSGIEKGDESPVLPYKLHERIKRLEDPWSAITLTVMGILLGIFATFALSLIGNIPASALAQAAALNPIAFSILVLAIPGSYVLLTVICIIILLKRRRM